MRTDVVIVGGGRVGRHAAKELDSSWYDITIVEREAEKCEVLAANDVSHVLAGDGTDETVLEEAGAGAADVVAALTNDTATNRTVTSLVAGKNPEAKTMVRIARDGEQELGHLSFIDNVVYPAAAGAEVAVGEINDY